MESCSEFGGRAKYSTASNILHLRCWFAAAWNYTLVTFEEATDSGRLISAKWHEELDTMAEVPLISIYGITGKSAPIWASGP